MDDLDFEVGTAEGLIDRQYMAHLIDAGLLCHGTSSEYEYLGDDMEEYNVELNPDTESKKNIKGHTSFVHNGYTENSEASPYYANTKSKLFPKLQEIVDNRYKDDNCKTEAIEVHLWEKATGGGYVAWKQGCYIVPTSYGGNTSGYQIPFTVNYFGKRTKGIFKDKAFTPDGAAETALSESAQQSAKASSKSNLS